MKTIDINDSDLQNIGNVIETTLYIVDMVCSQINVGFKTVNNFTIVFAHFYI